MLCFGYDVLVIIDKKRYSLNILGIMNLTVENKNYLKTNKAKIKILLYSLL